MMNKKVSSEWSPRSHSTHESLSKMLLSFVVQVQVILAIPTRLVLLETIGNLVSGVPSLKI